MAVKFEDFLYSSPAGFRYHEEGKLFEDVVIPLLVGFAKIAPGHRLPDAEMVELSRMGPIATMRSRRLSRFDNCPNISVSS